MGQPDAKKRGSLTGKVLGAAGYPWRYVFDDIRYARQI